MTTTKARKAPHRLGVALLAVSFLLLTAVAPAHAQTPDGAGPHAAFGDAKTVADGLYMTGYTASFGPNYSDVTMTIPSIHNDSAYATGTLRIEYWVTLTPPVNRGDSFASGHRLARFANLAPLAAHTSYNNVVQSSPMVVPPDGTYWFVVLLEEYDPANCSAADGFCVEDSLTGGQRTFGAQAAAYPLTVTLAGTGSGTVTSSQPGINCPPTCTSNFSSPASVSLTAAAASGSTFQGWSGACSGASSCNLTMTQAANVTATFTASSSSSNYSDIWWNPLESGWGLTVADHQTQAFAVWYTYRQDGSPTWFVFSGSFAQGRRILAGDVFQTTGPAYTATFNSSQVQATRVGSASIDFTPPALNSGTALFSYTIGSISQTKQIQRQPFGSASPTWGNDLTDIYWDPAESGWGLSISQHGTTVFAVWYTYDTSGQPLFVVMPAASRNSDGSFTGDIYTTTGPYFGNAIFDPGQVHATNVGTATMVFDPASIAAVTTKSTPLCRRSFMGCNVGKYIPCLHGACYGKWISPQRYGYSAPDTPAPACDIEYNDWGPCVNGTQFHTERLRNPPGCTGTAVLQQACTPNPQPCVYHYGAPYGACVGGVRTHSVLTATPANCTGTPTTTEPCSGAVACTQVNYSAWGDCQPNGTQTRSVVSISPPGCTYTPVTAQGCNYVPPGGVSAFDGTFAGFYDVMVTAYLPDGTALPAQAQHGDISVVIRNGAVTVNGAAASGNLTPSGNISFNASGSIGSCTYSGTMTASGGGGVVDCQEPGLYTAHGNWQLNRVGP